MSIFFFAPLNLLGFRLGAVERIKILKLIFLLLSNCFLVLLLQMLLGQGAAGCMRASNLNMIVFFSRSYMCSFFFRFAKFKNEILKIQKI
jgi:hypothetical protein